MNFNLKPFFWTCVIIATGLIPSFSVNAQDQVGTQTYGDWLVTCDKDNPCRMAQTVVQTSTKRLILQLRIFKGKEPTMLLTFPLGILLNTGWQYQIDGKRQTLLPFEICNSEGCHAGVKLTPKLLSSLKRGNSLSIKFFDAAKTTVNPVISLAGFTKAYGVLK